MPRPSYVSIISAARYILIFRRETKGKGREEKMSARVPTHSKENEIPPPEWHEIDTLAGAQNSDRKGDQVHQTARGTPDPFCTIRTVGPGIFSRAFYPLSTTNAM
jgi:hypothetical protein